ncbi:MAG TPA: Hsp20/alpha crystallin family protein [Myxococcota bacterium]|nr:Hsp20/alpha crystallin family protein [Myxococcota bacterium]
MLIDSRFDLFADLDQLRRRVDSAFGARAGGLDGRHGLVHQSRSLYPDLRLRDVEGGWEIVGDAAGLRAEDVEITLEGRDLRIQGRADEATPEGWRRVWGERRRWSFDKTLRFADPIDAAGVSAEVKNGVLRVTVPRLAPSGPVRIEVKS